MACCGGGYREDRFQTSIAGNFICAICQKVLKDPVQCHNEHYFCKACITQYLKNSQTCPVCMEKVTEETLIKPPRIVTNILNALIINCDHSERGCTQLIELVRLEDHTRSCKYKPVTCPNEKCAKIINLADFEEHTSEVCEYRQVYCNECEKDMSFKKYQKHSCVISKDVHAMKASLTELQDQVKEIANTQNEISQAQNEMWKAQKEMSKAQKEMLEAIKNVTADLEARDEIPQGNILLVAGNCRSVEMYSLAKRTWSYLASIHQTRIYPTAHFYNGQIMVTGGQDSRSNGNSDSTNTIEYIQIPEETRLQEKENCPDQISLPFSQLPIECHGHKTAIVNHHLWTVGGQNRDRKTGKTQCFNTIYATPVKSPSTHTVKCEMPKPLSFHGLEIVNENELLIMGGETPDGTVDSVMLYNTVTNTLREMQPLPFPMSRMATVKHEEDVIVFGGQGGKYAYLNTVLKYNCKKNEWEQLPGMKNKKSECAAVISGYKVFVMGGCCNKDAYLRSVDCFDIKHQVWHELPPMNRENNGFAAVLVP